MALFNFKNKTPELPESDHSSVDSWNLKTKEDLADIRLTRWQKVVEQCPNDHKSVLELCNVLNELKRYDEVEDYLTHLVDIFPNKRSVLSAIARQHLRRNRKEESLAAWIDIDKRWPNNVEPLQNIGGLMIRCGQAEQSLDVAKQLSEIDPDRADKLRIRAYKKLEKYKELLDLINKVSANRTLDADESAAKILALLNIEGCDTAIVWAKSAQDSFPKHKNIALELANLFSNKEQYNEALEVLESHSFSMNDTFLHAARRTALLVKLGRLDEADKCAEHALNENPNDKDLLLAHARIAQARFASI